jgi:hypothetical protein
MEIGFQTIVAFSLSLAIFILPGAIDPYLMAFFQIVLPLIFCLLAYRILNSAWPRYLRWGGCFILLLMGLMTYQANTFFFIFLTAATVMCAPDDLWPSARKMLLRNIAILGAAAIIYYLAVHFVFWARYPDLAANVSPGYAVKISLQTIWVKTLGLLGNASPTIFGFWTLPPSKILSFGLMTLCAISLVAFAMIKKTRTGWERLIAWVFLFFAVNGVWIASPAEVPLYRMFFSASAFALFTLFVCLVKWADILKLKKNSEVVLAVGLAVVGLFSANYIATKNAWNYNMELMFIRSQLAPYMGRDIKRIHVIAPVDNKIGYDGLQTSGDNFNNKTTHFSADTPDLLRVGMVDLPGRPTASFFSCEAPQPICVKVTPPGQILITKSEPGQPIYPSENMILINMNDLIKATGRKVVQ